MAKISRRAVASSSSSSSSSTSSAASAASTSISSASSASFSTSSGSPSLSANVNNIAYIETPYTRIYSNEISSKYAESLSADPLRDGGGTVNSAALQFASTTIRSNEQHPKAFTAHPTFMDSAGSTGSYSPTPPSYQQNKTSQAQVLAAERERVRAEFFATYDVMTGVRIAATLSGFFGLMVFLIVWKSRSSSNETLKVLKDPKMAAVAAVCMQEEEEREIQEAMVATGMSIYPDEYDAIAYRRQRMLSLGNVSAPPMLNRGYRFSSVGGGYSSLLEPPRRFSYSAVSGAGSYMSGRRKSCSESSRILSNYPMGSSFGVDDYFVETEDELENGEYAHGSGQRLKELSANHKRTDSTKSKPGFLEVPLMGQDSRRSSAMTCCSTDSSYLERRCSAYTLGLPSLPPTMQRKLSATSRTSSTDNWDYYYPDIQVIQPTPKPSPCPSERSIYEELQVNASSTTTTTKTIPTTTSTTTSKTVKANTAANGKGATAPTTTAPTFVRKHSIAYYDPESAQAGRKQQIHSISADTVDMYPYNQPFPEHAGTSECIIKPSQPQPPPPPAAPPSSLQSTTGVGGIHHGYHFTDSPTDELRLNVRRKIAVVELQRIPYPAEQMTPPPISGPPFENNNSYPYSNSAAAIAAAAAAAAAANSSSISIDSTPVSIDKLNGSESLGTISAKALFNAEKRAPLASLSSFKISSLEYQDSEMRSLDEDSAFLDSVADTDEDMQQLSSGSEEVSLCEHNGGSGMRESNIFITSIDAADVDVDRNVSTGARAIQPSAVRTPIEKRFSLGAASGTQATSSANRTQRRSTILQRHRTISVCSSDRVSLLGQQLKEFPSGSGTQTPTTTATSVLPLETHFGAMICTNSPPTHLRRAQLLQQYSDPQSMPTTTTTTTTTTTEDDTCSTLNTELCAATDGSASGSGISYGGGGGDAAAADGSSSIVGYGSTLSTATGGGGGSTSHTQYSSLNTVISFGRASPQTEHRHYTCISPTTATLVDEIQYQSETKQKLPRSRLADDPCASSISDSFITTRQPIISMPSSLKNLILRVSEKTSSSTAAASAAPTSASSTTPHSKSAINLRNFGDLIDGDIDRNVIARRRCPSVMLELPLIKLPTDESSESLYDSAAATLDNYDDDDVDDDDDDGTRTKSDESRDPSLPGTSRKWSKETLF